MEGWSPRGWSRFALVVLSLSALVVAGCYSSPPAATSSPGDSSPGPSATPTLSAPPVACSSGTPLSNLDRTYGLCVPPGWSFIRNVETAEFKLVAPPESESDGFLESIYVTRNDIADNATLDQFVDYEIGLLGSTVQNITFIAGANRTLGGAPAFILEYRGLSGQDYRHAVQVIAVREGIAYLITLLTEEGHQQTFQAPAEFVWTSFRYLR